MANTTNVDISNWSLVLALVLVAISLLIGHQQKLKLEKETIISVVRAVIQLILVGFVLKFIFQVNSLVLTIAMMLFIVFNAAHNGKKRAQGIPDAFKISWIGLMLSTAITMGLLVLTGVLKPEPYQLIPVTGMVASNSMNAIGLVYRSLNQMFKDQRNQVFERLALGADEKLASGDIMREAIRFGMQPTIDSVRTYGLVSLPGMMSGLIMAGVDPVHAIKYQIMVVFMLLSATGISSAFASFMAYRKFFTKDLQLRLPQD